MVIQMLRRNRAASGNSQQMRAVATSFSSSESPNGNSSSARRQHRNRSSRSSRSRSSGNFTEQTCNAATANLLHMRLRGLGDKESMLGENSKFHDDCVICTEAFAVKDVVCRLPCGHVHHSKCIMKWLHRDHDSCPTCRQPVTTQVSETMHDWLADNEDADAYGGVMIRRHNKAILQKYQNFDLIMRRVLRAQEEQRQNELAAEQVAAVVYESHVDISEAENEELFRNDTAVQPLKDGCSNKMSPISTHTRRTSFSNSSAYSGDWLVDDLEEFLLAEES